MAADHHDPYGFTWGPMRVQRITAIDRSNGTYRVLGVHCGGRPLEIYVSPTGRSVRVFRDGRELR